MFFLEFALSCKLFSYDFNKSSLLLGFEMIKNFSCPICGNNFQLETEKLKSDGNKGTCQKCKNSLVVFPDGRAVPFEKQSTVVPPPQPVKEDPSIWRLRLKATGTMVPGGPFNLAQILEFILEDKLTMNDEAMIEGIGNWLPLKAIPAMDPLFAEKVLKDREKFGDEDHCVYHPNIPSKWFCPKCRKYFCKDCCVNKPFVVGGADHFMCKDCDIDLLLIKKKTGGLGSLLGLKPKK